MFHDDLIGWTTMSRIKSIPYTIPFVYRYSTCPRFDRRYTDTLFNLVMASLFTRSVTHHPMINSLITLCTLWWCPTEWAQRYLSVYTEWQIPVSICANPTDPFGDTCSEPLQPPSYVVTFGTPKALLRYPGVAQSHGLRKWYLTLEKL